MPRVQGWLTLTPGLGGPNQDLPGGEHPDHTLPGGGYVDNTLPPPPGIWPPPVQIWPPTPLPPNYPMPPGSIWPPVAGHPLPPVAGHPDQGLPPVPGRPDQGLPVPGHPDQGLPGSPGHPDQGLPSQKFLVAIVAASAAGGLQVVGYTVVDPSLSVGFPLPGAPPVASQGPGMPTNPIAGAPRPEPKR